MDITKEIRESVKETMKKHHGYNEDQYEITNVGSTELEKKRNTIHINVVTDDLKHCNIFITDTNKKDTE